MVSNEEITARKDSMIVKASGIALLTVTGKIKTMLTEIHSDKEIKNTVRKIPGSIGKIRDSPGQATSMARPLKDTIHQITSMAD